MGCNADKQTSNAVPLITSTLLLKQGQILVVQTSLIGNTLSNMHLMLGVSFLVGGFRFPEQSFNGQAAKELGSLLLLACLSIIIPTAYHRWTDSTHYDGIRPLSRGTAVVLITTYIIFTVFQLHTHKNLFAENNGTESDMALDGMMHAEGTQSACFTETLASRCSPTPRTGKGSGNTSNCEVSKAPHDATLFVALGIASALIGFHTTFATDNLSSITGEGKLSPTFLGVVIFPLLSNDIGPIKAAWDNRMDRCLSSTVGKCVQMSLLVTPLVIFIGWGMGVDDMTLSFDGFEVISLFGSILYVNLLLMNGKSN